MIVPMSIIEESSLPSMHFKGFPEFIEEFDKNGENHAAIHETIEEVCKMEGVTSFKDEYWTKIYSFSSFEVTHLVIRIF